MKKMTSERIAELRGIREGLISSYGARDTLLDVYDEIYFMSKGENPKGLRGTDDKDIKETISSSGRDAVTGLKRILDSGDVQVTVKGKGGNPDKVEDGLKHILKTSGEYRIVSVEKDLNLSHVLYGPGILTVNLVDDMIESLKSPADLGNGYAEVTGGKNEYAVKKLEALKKKTPFMLDTISPRQSYPMFGQWGLVGHARKYKVKGAELNDTYGCNCDPNKTYDVKDFFYQFERLIEAEGISEPLMAEEWVVRNDKNEIIGSTTIPIFTRFAGGSSLFHEPEKQSQPLLYAKAKGNWHLRENLLWTYLMTAVYQQGLPGPTMIVNPEDSDQDVRVKYEKGIKIVEAKGTIQNLQVIDGDVLQMISILKDQASMQTVQPQALGENTGGTTFSQFALAAKAGLIPAIDPKEAEEQEYKDAFLHMLTRIKEEGIENEVISPADIPDDVEVIVTIAPDLEQDDLRNAQTAVQLMNSNAGLSKEWIGTNVLKISDMNAVWEQAAKEKMRDAVMERVLADENLMGMLVQKALKMQTPSQPASQPTSQPTPPEGMGAIPGMGGGMEGMEPTPKTDPMIPQEERM